MNTLCEKYNKMSYKNGFRKHKKNVHLLSLYFNNYITQKY